MKKKTNATKVKGILKQDPQIGKALTPVLAKFDHLQDMSVYADIASALLDAYRAGTKTGRETAEECIKEAFKWTGEA